MKLARKEHIVPRMLLSEFTQSDGRLWVYSKEQEPRLGRPEDECVERDFYEFEMHGRKTNNSYENWLSQIEGNAARLLNFMKERSSISSEDAKIWATFVASLFGRTKKVRTHVSEMMASRLQEHADNPDFIRNFQYSLLQRGELHYAEDITNRLTECWTEMRSSQSFFHVWGLPNRTGIIVESLLTRNWHTIVAPTDTHFVLSDCPVVTYEVRNGRPFPGTGFGNENAIAMLPISPRHLWVASPKHVEWKSEFTISGMDRVNRLIVQFADRNVYASVESEEIRRLVDSEINTVVFGMNAFVPPVRPATV